MSSQCGCPPVHAIRITVYVYQMVISVSVIAAVEGDFLLRQSASTCLLPGPLKYRDSKTNQTTSSTQVWFSGATHFHHAIYNPTCANGDLSQGAGRSYTMCSRRGGRHATSRFTCTCGAGECCATWLSLRLSLSLSVRGVRACGSRD